MNKYPITVAEYLCAVRAKSVRIPPEAVGMNWERQIASIENPVVCVSWEDALLYTKWITDITGEDWEMPTEFEWIKSASGPDTWDLPWVKNWREGDPFDPSRANIHPSGPAKVTAIGAYPLGVSSYGVGDMAGNVWEWCNTIVSGLSDSRILHGGSWNTEISNASNYYNVFHRYDYYNHNVGFRILKRD